MIAYNPVLSVVVKQHQIIQDSPHYIGFTTYWPCRKHTGYINTRTPLNTKLKRIAPNSQTKYGTKRKINKRYHLSGA